MFWMGLLLLKVIFFFDFILLYFLFVFVLYFAFFLYFPHKKSHNH